MNTLEESKSSPDLKPYQPYGIPMLKLLGGIAVISICLVIVYELFF